MGGETNRTCSRSVLLSTQNGVAAHACHHAGRRYHHLWLVNKLCGAFVTDAATASRSLLTNLDTTTYDDELVELFGLEAEAKPEIVANDAIVGTTELFGPPAQVAGLIVDQQAALLAQRCLTTGSAKCTF